VIRYLSRLIYQRIGRPWDLLLLSGRPAGRPCDVIIYLAARSGASIGGIKFRATRTASRETRDKLTRAVAARYTNVISER